MTRALKMSTAMPSRTATDTSRSVCAPSQFLAKAVSTIISDIKATKSLFLFLYMAVPPYTAVALSV